MGLELEITAKHVYLRKDGYELIKVRNKTVKAQGADGYSLIVTPKWVTVRYESFWCYGERKRANIPSHEGIFESWSGTFRGCVVIVLGIILASISITAFCIAVRPQRISPSRATALTYPDGILTSPNGRHTAYIDLVRPCAIRFEKGSDFNLRDQRCNSLSINAAGHLVIDNQEVVSSIPATHMELFDSGVLALMSNATRLWVIADADVERFKRARKLEREMNKLYK